MSKRDPEILFDDITEAIERINDYIGDYSRDDFKNDQKTIDAVVRNVEIIGEAASNIPESIRNRYSEIPWKKIVGVRNIVIHKYFGVDTDTLWIIIKEQLPDLKSLISIIVNENSKDQN